MKVSFLTLSLSCLFLLSYGQLKTARIFGDHMVLQRNQQVPVWGWGNKNAKVSVKFNGQLVNAKADEAGKWTAVFKAMPAGGPYMMDISSGKEHIVLKDIMLGEVWLCSGQSNMEFQLKNAFGYRYEQRSAAQKTIRQFSVPKKMSMEPDADLTGGAWTKCDTNTIGDFTAVGYYFAKKLSAQLNVTVGLINSNWGGTQVEDWISREDMLKSAELADVAKTLPSTLDDVKKRVDLQLRDFAYKKNKVTDFTAAELAAHPPLYFDGWQKGGPGSWEWQGKFYSYRGQGFMQRTIRLDSVYTLQRSILRLGETDADMAVYVNGSQLKAGSSSTRQFDIPPGTWKSGDNNLIINLQSQQKNPSWFGIGLNSSGNDLYVRFSDTSVNLSDYNWHLMPDLSKKYEFDLLPNNTAFTLYNAMINPLVPFSMAGVLWYQGESNTERAFQYRTSFPLLITDWRSHWKKELPFLFVQLSSFGTMQGSDLGSDWAELREAQSLAQKLPNTGMAVTTDIGDAFNIHPRDKADVGFRLAYIALNSVYQLPGFSESPQFSSAQFTSDHVLVSFDHAANGLLVKDKYEYLRGFELAGADHKFHYAQAMITGNNQVKVWSSQVTAPIAVRYAWTNAPVEANLFSKEGLPAAPFRSDDWKGITEGKKFE